MGRVGFGEDVSEEEPSSREDAMTVSAVTAGAQRKTSKVTGESPKDQGGTGEPDSRYAAG